MTKIETELPRQDVTSKSFTSPVGAESPNGFRHFTPLIREESRLVCHTDPYGLTAEQFRLLRRTLSQDSATGAVLMITSPGVGDGKTVTSLNLCTCLADSGDSTLLVEADLRRPTVRTILACAVGPPGIEDALSGKVEPSKAIHLIEKLSFHAATVAKIPDDPSRLLYGAMIRQFLAWARQHFRWVVLDAAPVLPAADVSELLSLTDGVLLVIRAQSTPREQSKRAIEVVGKHLYGVILNEVTIDFSSYYRYLRKYYREAGTS
jgi:capsular exopolysaccharide synthesis family protein